MGCTCCKSNIPEELINENLSKTNIFKEPTSDKTTITKLLNKTNKEDLIDEFKKEIGNHGKIISEDKFYEVIGERCKKEYKSNPYISDTTRPVESDLFEPGPVMLSDGKYYYGSWNQKGLMDGKGQFYTEMEGLKVYIDGVWVDGILEKGKIITDDSIYTGDISNGLYNGNGKIEYTSGVAYNGNFVDGIKNGPGILIFPDGTKFEGTFKNDEISGEVKITWPNGITYEGNISQGIFNGEGTLTDPKKGSYTGEFKNGLYHGQGTYIWKNEGTKYKGEYFDGKKNGYGQYYFSDGAYIEGNFESGDLNGECSYIKDEVKYIGEFAYGELINEFKLEKELENKENLIKVPQIEIKREDIEYSTLSHINTTILKSLYLQTEMSKK